MKNLLIHLSILLVFITFSCSKEDVNDIPDEDSPLKITKLLPLSDNIPYQALGSGKILFERRYDDGESVFYVIDIDKRKSSGFKLKSPITQPSISPSGTQIACSLLNAEDLNPTWNIYVMDLDGSDCFPAFLSDQPASYPTWSNDGSKIIYYTSGSDGRLYMQSPVEDASDRVELTRFRDDDDPEWLINPIGGFTVAPSGELVSVSESEKLFGLIDVVPYAGKTGVSIILSPPTDHYSDIRSCWFESPVFSPDGMKIAFLEVYTNPMETSWISLGINSMDPDGSNLVQVGAIGGYQPNAQLDRYVSLCWSPDGTKILFAMPDSEETCHLYVVNLDGSGYSQITNQMDVFDSNVSWSR